MEICVRHSIFRTIYYLILLFLLAHSAVAQTSKSISVRPLYPQTSKHIATLPKLGKNEQVRVEFVDFDEDGNANYLFGDPGHSTYIFVKGKLIEGYPQINRNGTSVLFSNETEAKVLMGWKFHPAYDSIMRNDGDFLSRSEVGNHWAYRAIKGEKGYIVTDRGTIALEDGWLPFHPPVFDAEGSIAYVIQKLQADGNSLCRAVYKNKSYERPLISQLALAEGKVVFSYMEASAMDTVNFAIDNKVFITRKGFDPNWAGLGLAQGDKMFELYNGMVYLGPTETSDSSVAYDLSGKPIASILPKDISSRFKKIGSITTAEGVRDVVMRQGQSYWYSSVEDDFYPAAISADGKSAYVKPVRIPLSSGYSISLEVVSSNKILKSFGSVRELKFVGDKLVFIAGHYSGDYVIVDSKKYGPYKNKVYDAIVPPLHFFNNKVAFAVHSNNTISWVVEEL